MIDGLWRRAKLARWLVIAPLCSMLAACAGIERLALPRAELGDAHWRDQGGASAQAAVDHGPWDRFLGRHVKTDPRGVNRLDYRAVGPDDRAVLDQYLEALSATAVSALDGDAQRALWINLYNALTVRLVLDHYPVASIRKIKPHFYAPGPWNMTLITIDGRDLSLNDIEHRILRPLWRDPRLHYALNCAATGCPNLQKRAFTPANTEALLEAAARAYINSPRGVSIDRRGRVAVSRIYVWFREDFGGDAAGVLDHLRRYAEPGLGAQLAQATGIHKYHYDWSLNDDRGDRVSR